MCLMRAALQIHYEGKRKGVGPWKLRLFWALKWQRAKRVPFGPKKALNQCSKFKSQNLLGINRKHVEVSALSLWLGSKQTKFWFEPKQTETNRNKICFSCVSVCLFHEKTRNKKFMFVSGCFCLFRCFEPISKQPKQTELFRNKTETALNFWKIPKYALYQTVSVGLLFVLVQSKHRNSLFRYMSETTETNCFETNQSKPKQTGKTLGHLICDFYQIPLHDDYGNGCYPMCNLVSVSPLLAN